MTREGRPMTVQQEETICITFQYTHEHEAQDTNNVAADLESLVEMDLNVYVETEEALDFDPSVSLETLALQSPHGSFLNAPSSSWLEENNEEDSEAIRSDRRRLSLRKELFQQRIKAQDLSSPDPASRDARTTRRPSFEQPEYDLASPLALPPSPSFYSPPNDDDEANNQDDAKAVDTKSKASPGAKLQRTRKAKHGGIYSLLLKGIKRTDDDAGLLVDPAKDNENAHPDTPIPSKFLSPSPSKMQVRHGGIYRMLREKT
ncbi:hypothetical protein AC1031_000785 [Aphanomyces cochlioides]|nr:hypothetical protein AC1031_000785 [Aphanomyces cochlioides]